MTFKKSDCLDVASDECVIVKNEIITKYEFKIFNFLSHCTAVLIALLTYF